MGGHDSLLLATFSRRGGRVCMYPDLDLRLDSGLDLVMVDGGFLLG